MDGVRFKVGDWVRRKPEFQAINWRHGSAKMRVVGVVQRSCIDQWLELQGDRAGCYDHNRFDLVTAAMDTHALGMALVLAGYIAEEWHGGPDAFKRCDEAYAVAQWLRACVTEELLSQEAE